MFLDEKNIKFSPPLPACHSYDRHSQKEPALWWDLSTEISRH